MTFPAEHFGTVKKRTWYKVRWNAQANPELAGKVDLLPEDVYQKQQRHATILETIETDTCKGGSPLRFGAWDEEKIDAWIKENKK
ncbi:MAG: hypothetical protein HYY37_04375 [Candidatus Aenigmarchaeota archaeon]|nr:hypothetical protein [Candidatus Aenigmarchaeota archaeon]